MMKPTTAYQTAVKKASATSDGLLLTLYRLKRARLNERASDMVDFTAIAEELAERGFIRFNDRTGEYEEV